MTRSDTLLSHYTLTRAGSKSRTQVDSPLRVVSPVPAKQAIIDVRKRYRQQSILRFGIVPVGGAQVTTYKVETRGSSNIKPFGHVAFFESRSCWLDLGERVDRLTVGDPFSADLPFRVEFAEGQVTGCAPH